MRKMIEETIESKGCQNVSMLLASGATVKSIGKALTFETSGPCMMVMKKAFSDEEMKAILAFVYSGAKVTWDDERDAIVAEYKHFYIVASRTYSNEGVYWSAGYILKKYWSEFIKLFDERKPADKLGFFAYNWKHAKAINHDLSWYEFVQIATSAREKDRTIQEKIEELL